MTGKKRFIYNGILMSAVGIAMRTVALFFNAFVSRTVGAEGLGLYTVVNTVYGFAVTFATSGISLTVTRLVASKIGEGKEQECASVLSGAILYALAFSALSTAAIYFGAELISVKILAEPRCERSLKILAPSLIPLALVSVFSGYFVGKRKVARNAVVQILSQVFRVTATVWLLLHTVESDIEGDTYLLSLGVTLTEVIAFLVILIEYLIDKGREKRMAPGAESVRAVAEVAVPLAVSAYIRQALLAFEHILIPKRLRVYGRSDSEALADYGTLHGMALPIVLYPMVILSSFSGLLVPEFAQRSAAGDQKGLVRLLSVSLERTLVFASAAVGIIFIFSEELGYAVYSSSDAGYFIAVLAPVIPIMYLDHVTDSALKGIGEQVYSMWVNITDSCLSIFLVWLLIPKMGILGYAVCIIAMEGYNFILSFIRLRAKIKIEISLVRAVAIPLACAVLSAAISRWAFISAGAETNPLWLIAEIVFSLCAFFFTLRIFNAIMDIIVCKIKKKQREKGIA